MMVMKRAIGPIIGIALGTACHAQLAILTVDSQPGDFIGLGQHKTIFYTPGAPGDWSSLFFVRNSYNHGKEFPTMIEFVVGHVTDSNNTNTFATFSVGTTLLGHVLRPGFYDNAQRTFSQAAGRPWIDFGFQNRGTSQLTGSFTIESIDFKWDGVEQNEVDNLDVTFEMMAQGSTAPCRGRFTYFSSVPEPASCITLALGGLFITAIKRRKS